MSNETGLFPRPQHDLIISSEGETKTLMPASHWSRGLSAGLSLADHSNIYVYHLQDLSRLTDDPEKQPEKGKHADFCHRREKAIF